MSAKKRSHKVEKLARIYDDEVLPVWSERFGRLLLRGLRTPERGQILDVACGTGYPSVELLRRMGPGCRLIAIDAASAMLDVARKKISEIDGASKKVFFRTESVEPKLSFADGVYDMVVCNLGLEEMDDPAAAIKDFARVTVPGGEVRCTLPLEGTFQEFYDIYREVLIKHDKHDAIERLNEHIARYPTGEQCESWLEQAGLTRRRVEVAEFSMLFKSSREFFFAPVIEYGPLAEWKAIAGKGQEMQDVFWYIKEAIDAYFGGRAFQVTVMAGCLIGSVRAPGDEDETGRVERIADLARHELDVAVEVKPRPADPRDQTGPRETGTEEIDLDELEEMEMETLDNADPVPSSPFEEESAGEIDAFIEGRQRPTHLSGPFESPFDSDPFDEPDE
jgi:ubiquinone/menaquinone biosynthesis C-methylase UbiE